MSDRRPENLWVLKDIGPEWEIERPATPADLLAVVRRGVESGEIEGGVVQALDATGWLEDMVVPVEGPGVYVVVGPVAEGVTSV